VNKNISGNGRTGREIAT
jgi:hypothetical protein